MPARLHVVHGSHPCATVERALALKGVAYRRVEYPPPLHAPIQRVLFGSRTVPAIRFADGEKVSGSRAIVAALERRVPDPPLYPADPAERARVEEAERWGDEVLQPLGRTLLWTAFARSPRSMVAYQQGARLPALPAPVVLALAPLITRVERRMNDADDERVRRDLRDLPGHLDRVDAWIAEGVLGGEPPNAADLQVATTLRLLMTIGDLRPLIEPRPAGALALRLFPAHPGEVPAGALPSEWLSSAPAEGVVAPGGPA